MKNIIAHVMLWIAAIHHPHVHHHWWKWKKKELWEVTYYTGAGQMADQNYTYIGAAACGFDVSFGTMVQVPGVSGLLKCEDREGPTGNPWYHIDVFGYRPGLGNDNRWVTVFGL